MGIIAKVGNAMQVLFGKVASTAAEDSGVIKRQRKFTALSLAQTFVLGFLQKPDASDEQLAQLAAQCGADVTPQAIEQRHTPELVKFLEGIFREQVTYVIGSDQSLAPILERFTKVVIIDSTTTTLPDELKERFEGCGGTYGGGQAAVKLQVEFDLRSGALTHVEIEPGRSPDSATSRQQARQGVGSLRISDLGYFNVPVFAEMTAASEYFLSRLQFGTKVMLPGDEPIELLHWLAQQPGPFIDQKIVLGKEQRLSCRLIAWRLPQEQANRRRQKLLKESRSKYGKEPSAERLDWCDWTILVTNVPEDKMSPKEAVVLYRARWQVELLFKRWKSQDLVAVLSGSTVVRQMVRIWSRLIAAVLQHWLVVASVWGNPTKSLSKTCEAIRGFVGRIAASLNGQADLERVLTEMRQAIVKTCGRDKRKKPGTFELLNDVTLLDFSLT